MSAIRNAPFASGTAIKGGTIGADNTFYHLTDHLGSVYYLTDEKGSIVTENDYDEFGIPLKQKSKTTIPPYNPMGYTGEPQHNEPDRLVYLRNRFYEPVSGRFINKDPIYLNSNYWYVINNPVKSIDPLGLQSTPWQWFDFGSQSVFSTFYIEQPTFNLNDFYDAIYYGLPEIIHNTTIQDSIDPDMKEYWTAAAWDSWVNDQFFFYQKEWWNIYDPWWGCPQRYFERNWEMNERYYKKLQEKLKKKEACKKK